MKKQLFPIEIVENSTEQLIKKNTVRTHFIYNIVLIVVLICFVLMFYISVDINVVSTGIIKTPGERMLINSPYGAFVEAIYVNENSKVKKGDTLLVLSSGELDKDIENSNLRLIELKTYISDLSNLVQIKEEEFLSPKELTSPLYTSSLQYYNSQYSDLKTRKENISGEYQRNKSLFSENVISASEFEEIQAEYNNANNAIELYYNKQISEWQHSLDNYLVEQRDISIKLEQIDIRKKESIILSPVAGIVQRIEGVHIGSYVLQGQKLFEFSADSTLLVECMIQPKDIGYIKLGQNVRMQVDAYNYNEWGLASGEVIEVFDDVSHVTSSTGVSPLFKVLCSINTPTLQLKNGHIGEIKRGMTVNARFKITQRTLFQLLYDKIDDWMNPNIQS
ncbi:MAG: efflux RND transporter periplasmic adaptor subunit [bacterium]